MRCRIATNLCLFLFTIFLLFSYGESLAQATLEPVTNFYLQPGAKGVAVNGNLAYVANDTFGIEIIDVTDPYAPSILGVCDTPGKARGITVVGNYAYVAATDSGMQIIDISDPTSPTRVGNYNYIGTSLTIAISGDYAYMTSGYSSMPVFNISNPTHPTLTAIYPGSGYLMGVAVSGNYAYVTSNFLEPDYGQIQAVDISDPVHPTLAGTVDIRDAGAFGIYVTGNYAFVGAFTYGVHSYDITDPLNMVPMGSYNTPGSAEHVVATGNYVVASDGPSGVTLLDISTLPSLYLLDQKDTPGNAKDVAVSGDYVFIADDNSLEIFVITAVAPPCQYIVGDVNGRQSGFTGLDIVYAANYMRGGPEPPYSCECTTGNTWFVAGDVNASCSFDGLDVTYMVNYLEGGPTLTPCPDCPPAAKR